MSLSVDLLRFAAAGNATAKLDIKDESVQRILSYIYPNPRSGVPAGLAEARTFAKYLYSWGSEFFIVYVVVIGLQTYQYILKEPAEGENTMSRNTVTDRLVDTVGRWQTPIPDDKYVYVYDGFWQKSKKLYEQVKTASWDDVILNEDMKKAITELMHKFFDSRGIYKDLGIPWKRGVIFHGPAGVSALQISSKRDTDNGGIQNGKTISIKALMNSLFKKIGDSIPSLYVKHAPSTYDIRSVFQQARYMAPCLLIFEDIDTVVTNKTRSYFFNEVDGLGMALWAHTPLSREQLSSDVPCSTEDNDGIFMVASTNHLDRLDPGLSSRPSRFDRKYLFPLPSESERILYCSYWRSKLAKNDVRIEFPKKLCPAIASITDGFSFAYLQEAFVATLVVIAGRRSEAVDALGGGNGYRHDDDDDDDDDNELNKYELWREIKKQVRALRDDMDNREPMAHGTTVGVPLQPTPRQLILRARENESAKTLANSRLERKRGAVGVDNLKNPLISDGGIFMDIRSTASDSFMPR